MKCKINIFQLKYFIILFCLQSCIIIPINLGTFTLSTKDNIANKKLMYYSGIFTPDGKQFYFTSNRYNKNQDSSSNNLEYRINHDIWVVDVSYKNNSLQFTNLKNANELMNTNNISEYNRINSSLNEGSVYFSPDGNYMYFTACNRPNGKGSCDIYVSTKANNKWSEAVALNKNINSDSFESDPFISTQGDKLLFISNRKLYSTYESHIKIINGNSRNDIFNIYSSDFNEKTKSWSKAELIKNISSDYSDKSPYLNNIGDTLFFSTNRFTNGEYYQLVFSTWDKNLNIWSKPEIYQTFENSFYNEMFFKYSYDNKFIIINNNLNNNTDLANHKLLFNSTRDWIKNFEYNCCDSLNIQIYRNK